MAFSPFPTREAIGWSWRAQWLPPVKPRRFCLRMVWYVLGGGIIAACLALICGFFIYVDTVQSYSISKDHRADGIVTLTGGAQRIDEALQLLAQGQGKRMLISGVNERTTREEIVRRNPSHASLFNCCIDLDYMARNTIGNAIQARRWAVANNFSSLIIVTSNYHMPRTMVELRHVMPNIQKIPYAVSAGSIQTDGWWHDGTTLQRLANEYIKYLVAWVRTQIEVDPELSSTASILGKPVKTIVEPSPR